MSSLGDFNSGQLVRLSASFTDASNAAADPTTVACKVRHPSGAVDTYASPTKDSTGHYHQDVTVDAGGLWTVRWEGTGAVVTAGEGTLVVLPPSM
jgi:hypothetical protein